MPEFTSVVDAALLYAEIGWRVFPVKPAPAKAPLTQHGFLDASVDRDLIVAWWRKWPDAQIGLDCGGSHVCAIDLDLAEAKDGISAFARLEEDHGPHWCGLIASTPRGGRHMLYLLPEGGAKTRSSEVGIDVRATGGYILLPSPASPGREWIIGSPFDRNDDGTTDLGVMPPWVEDLVRAGQKPSAAAKDSRGGESASDVPMLPATRDAIARALTFLDAGPRDTWIRVAMALKSTGAGPVAYELWAGWSMTSPKWDEKIALRQWASLREYFVDGHEITLGSLFHLAKEAGYVPSIEDELAAEITASGEEGRRLSSPDALLPTVPAAPRSSAPLAARRPFDRGLLNVPGLLGSITAWLLDVSTRQQPALCLASAIATLGAVLGRRIASPTDLRTNVYCLGIGETACGKDVSVRMPRHLLFRAGLAKMAATGEWKSDSGLRSLLLEAPSHAAYCDEFTKRLEGMSGKDAPSYLRGIKSYLLELWGASNSAHLAPAYADRNTNVPVAIEQPNLCLYGAGVPSELFSAMDRGALTDGFINRMLIFFSDDQMPPRRKVGRAEPPDGLVDELRKLDRTSSVGDLEALPTSRPVARMLAMTDEADALLTDLENANDARILRMRKDGDVLSDLWVRYGAHIVKLALIRSASDDLDKPIELADVTWARDLVSWCIDRTAIEVGSRISDSRHEADTKRVQRLIEAAGDDGLTGTRFSQRTQWLKRGERKDILATLLEGGAIVAETAPRDGAKGGSPTTRYRRAREGDAYS